MKFLLLKTSDPYYEEQNHIVTFDTLQHIRDWSKGTKAPVIITFKEQLDEKVLNNFPNQLEGLDGTLEVYDGFRE